MRFLSGGVVYQFKALCFGLSTAPQVFTRVFAAVSGWAHSHGIRLLRYLGNWLVLASLEAVAIKNVQDLLSLCLAMFLALQSFQEEVTGCRVTAMCDNSTVVAYVNKQGGTVSRSLCSLASHLLRWTGSFNFHLDARYLPGQSNVLTDLRSLLGSSHRDRVVSAPAGDNCSAACLGFPVTGLVHDAPQREASPILFPRPRSPGGLRGCISPSLGQPGRVRISTLSAGRAGGGQSQ